MDTEHGPEREHPDQAEPDHGEPDPDMQTQKPEALQAAQIATDREPEATVPAKRVRGVEWVRPADLMARHGAAVSGRGIDFQAELARRARAPITNRVRRVGDRSRQLPPLSAFGRGHANDSGPRRSGVGMS